MTTNMIKAGSSQISADREVDAEPVSADLDGPEEVETTSDDTGTRDERPSDADATDGGGGRWPAIQMEPQRLATVFGIIAAVVLASVVGWLGYQGYQARHAAEQRAEFLQAGRQGAVNLTTIDWQHADADVQRILDAATGTFYDDFSQRSQPFIDVVKKAQSASVGSITAAGLESSTITEAQVLVAVSVKTTNAGAPQEGQRAWRMRLTVQKMAGAVKVSDVEFIA